MKREAGVEARHRGDERKTTMSMSMKLMMRMG